MHGNDDFFYGTTREGLAAFFAWMAPGNLALLHSITDSGQPVAGLIRATDGLFYGTTNGPPGTVFRIDAAGSYAVINRFDGTGGFGLNERLLQVNDALFYGTVPEDGPLDIPAGELFRLGSAGNVRVLHPFTQSNAAAGIIPNAQLVQSADGALYGTTGFGGSGGHGTIFRLDLTMPTPPHLQLRRKVRTTTVTSGTATRNSAT